MGVKLTNTNENTGRATSLQEIVTGRIFGGVKRVSRKLDTRIGQGSRRWAGLSPAQAGGPMCCWWTAVCGE